jgi:hypothetical protein
MKIQFGFENALTLDQMARIRHLYWMETGEHIGRLQYDLLYASDNGFRGLVVWNCSHAHFLLGLVIGITNGTVNAITYNDQDEPIELKLL